MGEAGKGGSGDEHDEDAAVPTALVVGSGPDALAIAIKLLKAKWNVKLVAPTPADAAAAKAAIARYTAEAEAANAREQGVIVHAVTSAGSAAVAEIKDGWKLLQDKAAGVGSSNSSSSESSSSSAGASAMPTPSGIDVSGASSPSVPGSGVTTPTAVLTSHHHQHKASAGSSSAAVDEHGHKIRRLDDGFEALALLADGEGGSSGGSDNPFLSESAALSSLSAASGGVGGGGGGGQDFRYARLVSLVTTDTRTLAAVAVALPSDVTSFAACRALSDAIAGAPKRSHLHSVRISVLLHSPAWAPAYASLGGVIPMHATSAASHLTSVLLTSPLGQYRPLSALPGVANKDELAKATGKALLEGPHYWPFIADASAAASPASLPPAVTAFISARAAAKAGGTASPAGNPVASAGGSGANGSASSASSAASGSGGGGARDSIKSLTKSLVSLGASDAEEVPEWQRDEYLSSLQSLDDNAAVSADVLQAKVRAKDQLEMYGSISAHIDGDDDGDGGDGSKSRGLASQDANNGSGV